MKAIFTYELKHWLKNWKFYMYLFFFSSGTLLVFAGTAGFFDPQPEGIREAVYLNAPYELLKIWNFLLKPILFLIPAIVGAIAYRDFKSKTHSVLYTYPIKKRDYFLGKFTAGFIVILFIVFATALSMFIAEQLPNLHTDKIGEFNIMGYVQSIAVYITPNILFISMIVFSIVLYFRNIYAGFVVIVAFFLIRNILPNAIYDTQWLAILDPFGEFTFLENTSNWSRVDKNLKDIPTNFLIFINRTLWFVISTAIFYFTYKNFELHENRDKTSGKKKLKKDSFQKEEPKSNAPKKLEVSKLNRATNNFTSLFTLSRYNFNYIVKSWMFYTLLMLGVLSVFFAIVKITNGKEIVIMPVTNVVLSIPAFFFTTIITLLTFMYTGMLVNRDKAANMNLLVDSTPIPNVILLMSKLMAILKMQVVLLMIMMIVGMGIQIYNGYFNFEISQYLLNLFFIQFIGLVIWAITSLFVHVLFRNTFVGIFTLILVWLGGSSLPVLGIETKLILFNFFEPLPFSDMYGYGNSLVGFAFGKLYWLAFATLLAISSVILVVRGQAKSIKERLFILKLRFSRPLKIASLTSIVAIFLTGFIIYDNEHKNDEMSSSEMNKAFKEFKEEFKTYARLKNQPKVVAMDLDIALYPQKNKFTIKGEYTIVNKTKQPIDTILLKTGFDETTTFSLDAQNTIIQGDDYVKFWVIKLKESLQPKDSLSFYFESKSKNPSAFDNNLEVVKNGSYIKNDLLPRFGYFLEKENHLPTDSLATKNNYFSRDSDLINVKTRISTKKGQKAFAVGDLKNKWEENERVYFEYETSKPLKNSLSFMSADYKEVSEEHKGVDFKVNAIDHHHTNTERMISGLKASYDYNTKYFTPYQHNDANIIEFPKTFGTYATVTGNLIPTSEIRFIANTSKSKADLSFYAIAHEFTHYWWGNQVMPADALGAVMVTESVTEYLSLHIYRDHFGEEKALQFLQLQRDRYLRGRTRDTGKESTLEFVPSEKQYISYAKGAMMFNALSTHIGEEKLNAILKDFLLKYNSKKEVYPTSSHLIETLNSQVPEEYKYMIQDGFRDIIFHDISLTNATSKENKDGFEVNLNMIAKKHSYKDGQEKELMIEDHIQVGFYDGNGDLIEIKTIIVDEERFITKIQLKSNPSKIIIDPNVLLIEKIISNNSISF